MAKTREAWTIYYELASGEQGTVTVSPDVTVSEVEAILGHALPGDVVWQRQQQAEMDVTNIPGWATWTEAQALAWHDTNIGDVLAAAPDIDTLTAQQFQNQAQAIMAGIQDVLNALATENRALVRIVVALRNKTWPALEGDE